MTLKRLWMILILVAVLLNGCTQPEWTVADSVDDLRDLARQCDSSYTIKDLKIRCEKWKKH